MIESHVARLKNKCRPKTLYEVRIKTETLRNFNNVRNVSNFFKSLSLFSAYEMKPNRGQKFMLYYIVYNIDLCLTLLFNTLFNTDLGLHLIYYEIRKANIYLQHGMRPD